VQGAQGEQALEVHPAQHFRWQSLAGLSGVCVAVWLLAVCGFLLLARSRRRRKRASRHL